MTRTLLIAIEVEDPGELPDLALSVQDILLDLGIPVISVKPWNSAPDVTKWPI